MGPSASAEDVLRKDGLLGLNERHSVRLTKPVLYFIPMGAAEGSALTAELKHVVRLTKPVVPVGPAEGRPARSS